MISTASYPARCASPALCANADAVRSTAAGGHRARPERGDRRLGVAGALGERRVAVAPGVQHLQRDRAALLVHRVGHRAVPLGLEPGGQLAGERLEPAALGRRVATGDDQADTTTGALGEVRRQLGDVPGVVLQPGVHRAHHHAVAQGQVTDRDRLRGGGGSRSTIRLPVGLEVLGEPLDPELLLLDAAAQDQPGVEVVAARVGRCRGTARARAARSGRAGCGGPRRGRRRGRAAAPGRRTTPRAS